MIVDVIEFALPNGRQVPHELEILDDCKEKYEDIVSRGCRLTCEMLRTGEVSQCIEHEEGDYDIILTEGSDMDENKKKLEEMILRFDIAEFDKWLKRATES